MFPNTLEENQILDIPLDKLRLERIDYGENIYDETTAVVPGLSFRPNGDTRFSPELYPPLAPRSGGNAAVFGFAAYF